MKYNGEIFDGIFVSRPNRFIAMIKIQGKVERCHVKNTSRCAELLIPGVRVYVEKSSNPDRKTGYSLIAVYKEDRLINIDSQAPNAVACEWVITGNLRPDIVSVKREVPFGNSRFDLYAETGSNEKIFIEVKGVTLEDQNAARFPDAPTIRGVKHIYELCEAVKQGYEAYILFVIQMEGMVSFTPNDAMHKEFGEALRFADAHGVHVLAVDCIVEPDTLRINNPVRVIL
jgi:sugar fermentation stimulation protein A